MSRFFVLIYGLLAYAFFFCTFLYAIFFVEGMLVPKTMNSGEVGPIGPSIAINVTLLALFAIQHTIMARPAFKRWFTTVIPAAAERSTFVVFATALLALICWQWQPMPVVLWDVQQPVFRTLLYAISFAGFGMVLYSSFLINHFDLFGLRQVVLHLKKRPYTHGVFMERSLYRIVRHPLMLGFMIAFWVTPTMTQGHLLFAAVTTGYIIFGTWIEERDLVKHLGDDYRAYQRRTSKLLPIPKIGARPEAPVSSERSTA